jgi:hypothetical protein
MKLEHFEKLLNEYRKASGMISELHDIGVDLMEGRYKLSDSLYNMFIYSLDAHYTDMGVDWVTWFIYENDWGEKDWKTVPLYERNSDGTMELVMDSERPGATDENGNLICYDIQSLWQYIEKEHKLQ